MWFKRIILMLLLIVACSPQDEIEIFQNNIEIKTNYSQIEFDVLELVNQYRDSIGLNKLVLDNYISSVARTHSVYMASSEAVGHANFPYRVQMLKEYLNAESVAENVAFGFSSANGVFNAWLKSEGHKKLIEKTDVTHFGISIESNNRNYFTMIFIKL